SHPHYQDVMVAAHLPKSRWRIGSPLFRLRFPTSGGGNPMRRSQFLSSVAAIGFVLAFVASPAAAQADEIPTISGRYFASGTAKVKVTGSGQIDTEIPINAKASFGDGEMTWLQFGVSGAAEPNALVTFQASEIGFIIGKGKFTVTAGVMAGETPPCSG